MKMIDAWRASLASINVTSAALTLPGDHVEKLAKLPLDAIKAILERDRARVTSLVQSMANTLW